MNKKMNSGHNRNIKMKNKKHITTYLIFLFLIFSCGHTENGPKALYGTWRCNITVGDNEVVNTMAVTANYKDNGIVIMSGSGKLKVMEKIAFYSVEDESEWSLKDNTYIERTIRHELVAVNGDDQLIEILKNTYSEQELGVWKNWNVIKLNKKKFIIETNDDDGSKMIMELERVF